MKLLMCSLLFNLLSHFSVSVVDNLRFLQLDRSHTLISPSVAKADLCNLLSDCSAVVSGGADMLHFSVQDGRFVPKISFGHDFIKALRPHFQSTVFDVKLGVIEPEHRIKDFVKAGADIISIHPEASYQPLAVIQMISDGGCIPGLVLNPSTSIESILYMIDHVQVVVFMLVSPGWGGKSYIPATVEKIKKLVKICEERNLKPLLIEVDGGVSISNVQLFLDAGANTVVSGSGIFSAENKKQAIDDLRGSNN